MSQHFLLTSAARTLSIASVARMSDEEAERVFIRLRWADNDGNAYCPHCGCTIVYSCPTEWRSALALQSLPQGFLGHQRNAVRVPQAAAALLPSGDCDFLQRGQGQEHALSIARPRNALRTYRSCHGFAPGSVCITRIAKGEWGAKPRSP